MRHENEASEDVDGRWGVGLREFRRGGEVRREPTFGGGRFQRDLSEEFLGTLRG
jgi:hypothetical protein